MGMNTVVVLFNDMASSWPDKIYDAMRNHGYNRDSLSDHFGYGQVLSVSHADWKQLVWAGQNGGGRIQGDDKDIPQDILIRMAYILENNGYKVTKKRVKKNEVEHS